MTGWAALAAFLFFFVVATIVSTALYLRADLQAKVAERQTRIAERRLETILKAAMDVRLGGGVLLDPANVRERALAYGIRASILRRALEEDRKLQNEEGIDDEITLKALEKDLAEALRALAWQELLAGHPPQALDAAKEAMDTLGRHAGDPELSELETRIRANLAHCLLLGGHYPEASRIYLANKNNQAFVKEVLDDFNELKTLKLTNRRTDDVIDQVKNALH